MKILRCSVLVLIFGLIPIRAEEIVPTENTKGCIFTGTSVEGNCLFIFFVKVADSEYESENGEPQIWGYNPEDIHKDKNGKPFYVTFPANKFTKAGWPHGRCHCPNW